MTWETSSSIPITTAKAHSSLSEVNIRPGTGSHRTIRQRSPRKCLQFESLFCILHTNIKKFGQHHPCNLLQSNGISNEDTAAAGAALPPDKTETAVTTAIVIMIIPFYSVLYHYIDQ